MAEPSAGGGTGGSGGDDYSGGGDFVWDAASGQWLLSAVHSWGWQGNDASGQGACDFLGLTGCDARINNSSSYGDLSGSTAVFDQLDGNVRAMAKHFARDRRQIYRWIESYGLADRRKKGADLCGRLLFFDWRSDVIPQARVRPAPRRFP